MPSTSTGSGVPTKQSRRQILTATRRRWQIRPGARCARRRTSRSTRRHTPATAPASSRPWMRSLAPTRSPSRSTVGSPARRASTTASRTWSRTSIGRVCWSASTSATPTSKAQRSGARSADTSSTTSSSHAADPGLSSHGRRLAIEPPPAVPAVLTRANRRGQEPAETRANPATPKPTKPPQTHEKRTAIAKARQHRCGLDKLGVTGSSSVPPIQEKALYRGPFLSVTLSGHGHRDTINAQTRSRYRSCGRWAEAEVRRVTVDAGEAAVVRVYDDDEGLALALAAEEDVVEAVADVLAAKSMEREASRRRGPTLFVVRFVCGVILHRARGHWLRVVGAGPSAASTSAKRRWSHIRRCSASVGLSTSSTARSRKRP